MTIYMDVDAALAEVPVNIAPLTDSGDFVSIESAVAYNATGMALYWHFITTAGAYTATAVTPTTGGNYDWAHQQQGMYTIEIPASGGASINNDAEGFGYFTGVCDGVLPWRGPTICFRAAAINDADIDGGDLRDVNVTQIEGADPTDTIRDAVVDDATRIDASALNTASGAIGSNGSGLTEAGGDGDHLTAINLPNQTMDIIGNITGNLSGSVGSVTGNVGGIAGTITTLDALDTAQDSQHSTTLSKLLKYFQLLLRSDAAIATDNATELTAINADGGSGAGAFANTTDSLEAVRDRGDAAWTTGGGADAITVATGTIGATGNDTTHLHLDGLAYGDDALNGLLIRVYDDSASLYYSTWITDWATSGDLATVETLPFTPEASTDTYTVLAVRKDGDTAGIKARTDLALPAVTPGAANGLVIAGTNAPILFTGTGNAFAAVSTSGGHGFYGAGNGANEGMHLLGGAGGSGLAANGGANANGAAFVKGSGGSYDIYAPVLHADLTGDVGGNVDGNVGGNVTGSVGSLATQAKADVNAEVDSALNTAIPGTPTTGSVNERLKTLDEDWANDGRLDVILDARASQTSVNTAQSDLDILTGTDGVTLATSQPNYAPAVAGAQMDLVNAPNATAVTAIQNGLAATGADGDTLETLSDQIDLLATAANLTSLAGKFTGITLLADWLRRMCRGDAGTVGMVAAQSEINTGGTSTYDGTTDNLQDIKDAAGSGGGGGTTVSVSIPAATARAVLEGSTIGATIGDTLRVTLTGLGSLADRETLRFIVKRSKLVSDDDAIILIGEDDDLTRLNGAATSNATWGTLTVIDEDTGEVDILLYASATKLLSAKDGLLYSIKKTVATSPDDAATLAEGKMNVEQGIMRATS